MRRRAAGVGFSAIPNAREPLLFVYDLENTAGSNWDSTYPEVKLASPSGNEFEPSESDLPEQIRAFPTRCGYSSPWARGPCVRASCADKSRLIRRGKAPNAFTASDLADSVPTTTRRPVLASAHTPPCRAARQRRPGR